MKKIVTLLCALTVLGSGLWAQDALLEADVASLKVTVYGDANARFGMQSMTADNTHPWSAMLMSGLSGNTDALMALLLDTSGSPTAEVVAAVGNFGAALGAQVGAAEGVLANATGAETDIARRAGFTQADVAGITAWLTANGMNLLFTDLTLAGHLDLPSFTKSGMYYGMKNENAVRLGTKIASADGKLTADIAARFSSTVSVNSAWIQYDLGPVAVKYNAKNGNQRWDADILYVGDATLENALDIQIKPIPGIGYAFLTLMSDEGVTSGVKYFNTEFRQVPMMQAGYVYAADLGAMGTIEATAGGALDAYTKKGDDYLGFIGFGGATWAKGAMAMETGSLVLGLNGLYGQNTATLAGMNATDMEQATLGMSNLVDALTAGDEMTPNTVSAANTKNSVVYGGRLFGGATVWTGGVVSMDARLSQLKFAGKDKAFTAMRFTGGVTQFLSGNFNVTLGGGYERYSVEAGNVNYKPASGYEITLDVGYMF